MCSQVDDKEHDRRVTELLQANNTEVEKRRLAENELTDFYLKLDSLTKKYAEGTGGVVARLRNGFERRDSEIKELMEQLNGNKKTN